MRNRAKCRLCSSIIESFHLTDYVQCKCGEIAIEGGESVYRSYAKDYANFQRVDDKDNVIPVKVSGSIEGEKKEEALDKPGRKQLLDELDMMIKSIENLPQHAMSMPVSNYDLLSSLLLMSALFKAET